MKADAEQSCGLKVLTNCGQGLPINYSRETSVFFGRNNNPAAGKQSPLIKKIPE
jgi:hypothetical protein